MALKDREPARLRIALVPLGDPSGHQPGGEREAQRREREPTGRGPGGEPTGRSPGGDLDPAILTALRDDLAGIFAAEIEVYPPMPLRQKHLARDRGQYLADDLLGDLSAIVSEPGTIPLGVTAADLFSPGMNFVYGIAGGGRALISVYRLRPEFEGRGRDPGLLRRRVLIEAVHELGHALGLAHCEYAGCVMYFSNWIGDTDRKGPGFCYRCARALERRLVS